ncbi:MFS transporter [Lentilactobacillus diolivorans]|uniref:MFS transporter n=1 Tax=Lentilactobacillus diolivorans TaxID=179838 RepID=UPI0024699D78|nr:MFS transporter [Lentilactobacillus diolivorans]MDH5105621.1 MFS transporter [Lentilactobacillus diolivorans]
MFKKIKSPYNSFGKFWSYVVSEMSFNFIWPVVATYSGLWLVKYANFSHANVGLAFSMMSLMGLISSPFVGYLGDKVLEKKYLLLFMAICSVLLGPFMQWIVLPMHGSTYVMAIILGLVIGLVMNGGTSVNEQYEQRMSFVNNFQYSWVRSGVTIMGFIAPLICGYLLTVMPRKFFWGLSVSGFIYLLMVIFFLKHDKKNLGVLQDKKAEKVNLKGILKSVFTKKFIFLIIFLLGTVPLSQIADQQIINYFQTFFNTSHGTELFSYVTTIQQVLAFVGMIIIPWVIKRIGYRNGLAIMAIIMGVRLLILAFAPNWVWVAFAQLLTGIYTPFWFVCPMGYIFSVFNKNEFATIQSLSTGAAVQISQTIFSGVIGMSYDRLGFHLTYTIIGIICMVFALFGAAFLVRSHKSKKEPAAKLSDSSVANE